ncbi:MAG: AtpZ/AtpI family protein [Pseudomonadota bacterium]
MGDDSGERSDLEALGAKIARARGDEPGAKQQASTPPGAGMGDGLRVATEFVVSVIVGSGLGYTIGSFLGAPLVGLLIGMPFGFAAGLRTAYRGMVKANAAHNEEDVPDGND